MTIGKVLTASAFTTAICKDLVTLDAYQTFHSESRAGDKKLDEQEERKARSEGK